MQNSTPSRCMEAAFQQATDISKHTQTAPTILMRLLKQSMIPSYI